MLSLKNMVTGQITQVCSFITWANVTEIASMCSYPSPFKCACCSNLTSPKIPTSEHDKLINPLVTKSKFVTSYTQVSGSSHPMWDCLDSIWKTNAELRAFESSRVGRTLYWISHNHSCSGNGIVYFGSPGIRVLWIAIKIVSSRIQTYIF
jgi:hypothetical protein